MTLDELKERGRTFARDGVPLGAGLRKLAEQLDRELDEFDDHERRAYADGWHEATRQSVDDESSTD